MHGDRGGGQSETALAVSWTSLECARLVQSCTKSSLLSLKPEMANFAAVPLSVGAAQGRHCALKLPSYLPSSGENSSAMAFGCHICAAVL